MGPLAGREVVLGVTGGIAAYKSAELVRGLKEAGAYVTVMMTEAAAKFVSPLTFEALSGRPALTALFGEGRGSISHIEVTANAAAFVVAPATANMIGKMAAGIADDLLSTALLAARCPVLVAPAMNCRMYESLQVRRNIETLRGMGVYFVGPEEGPMACNEYGWGRMSEPAAILDAVRGMLASTGALAGKSVLVTAGPTLEDIDPVRFIGNRSSGRMGYAIAAEARKRGASVTLVSGPTSLTPPPGVEAVMVRSASEMHGEVVSRAAGADVIVMAAAVSDYACGSPSACKIKKGLDEMELKLVRTPDILKGLGASKREGQVLVGFAAETESLEENALAKLKEKRLDLVAANKVGGGEGFGSPYNRLYIYGKGGLVQDTGMVTKEAAASALLDCITPLL